MKRLHNRLIILSICVLLFLPDTALSASEKRIALVIGNGNYQSAPLKNPVNDAKDIAFTLNELGFEVTLKTNVTQKSFERAIRDFGVQLKNGGVGLFYYAGHGFQVKGSNYLIPIGAVLESEGDARYEAVDAGLVLAKMEDAGNGLNIIILDACRNNPFTRSFRSAEKGLAKMDAPTGSILAYATAPGNVAADGVGRNGLYTEKLLKHIATPDLKIEEVFKRVRIDVAFASGKKQTPWESSSLMGDFYFSTSQAAINEPVRAIGVEEKKDRPAVAVVTPLEPIRKEAQSRYRLAIFPLKLYTSADNQFYVDRVEISGIKGIAAATRDDDRLELRYCYRELEGFTEEATLLQEALRTHKIKFWKRRTLISRLEPDWEAIKAAGLKIQANPIVIISGDINSGKYTCYIYDPVRDRIFSDKIETFYLAFEGEIEAAVRKLMRAYFKTQ